VDVRRFPAWPTRPDYYLSPELYGQIGRNDWDLVHVQGCQTAVAPMAMLAAGRARVPYLLTFHDRAILPLSRLRASLAPLRERMLRRLIARADRLVALTPSDAHGWSSRLRLPPERFVVIPNGGGLPPSSPGIEREPALIASVGRFNRHKGQHWVIAALPHVATHRPDAHLLLIGGNPKDNYDAELRRLADHLGVSDRVEIEAITLHEGQRLADELARIHVVVSMSEYEHYPLAVLDAVRAGCRAVVARSPGLSELVDQGIARGVELTSAPEELAAAIIEELDKPPPATPPPATPPPLLLTWDDCADRLLQVYEDVVAHRARTTRTR
jgi:glycosyltransferase involved in cell wall biosynthesis